MLSLARDGQTKGQATLAAIHRQIRSGHSRPAPSPRDNNKNVTTNKLFYFEGAEQEKASGRQSTTFSSHLCQRIYNQSVSHQMIRHTHFRKQIGEGPIASQRPALLRLARALLDSHFHEANK